VTLRLRIQHGTRFEYERPIAETVMELRLQPPDTAAQRVLDFALEVSPPGPASSHVDGFGNIVHHIERPEQHDAVEVVAISIVECNGSVDPYLDAFPPLDMLRFGGPIVDVPAVRRLALAAARRSPTGTGAEGVVESLSDRIAEQIRYEKGRTSVHSNVAEVLALGAGVCQDFAHVMIACCRSLGIPARYVSGYVYDGEAAEHESHAWMQAWFEGVGWRGFDATHRVYEGERHIKVATGRDYTDCAPTRGTYVGNGGTAKMTARVTVRAEDT
jgi:transglutaminase-like putative cysteine protease